MKAHIGVDAGRTVVRLGKHARGDPGNGQAPKVAGTQDREAPGHPPSRAQGNQSRARDSQAARESRATAGQHARQGALP